MLIFGSTKVRSVVVATKLCNEAIRLVSLTPEVGFEAVTFLLNFAAAKSGDSSGVTTSIVPTTKIISLETCICYANCALCHRRERAVCSDRFSVENKS